MGQMLQQRSRFPSATIILVGLSVVFLLPSAAAFYTDWLWFKEVGFEAIFARRIRTSFLTGGRGVRGGVRGSVDQRPPSLSVLTQPYVVIASTAQGQPILFNRAQVRRAATIIATVAALAMALPASSRWLDLLESPRRPVRTDRSDLQPRRLVLRVPAPRAATSCAGSRAIVILSLVIAAGLHPRRCGRDRAA